MGSNSLELEGMLVELAPRRLTPSGTAVVEGVLEHESVQTEAGLERKVFARVPIVAVGELAAVIAGAPLGSRVNIAGFLAAKSLKGGRLALHVSEISFKEGHQNGIQTQAP